MKYDQSFLKILAEKYPNNAFLVPNLCIFFEILQLHQFEGTDIKNDNSIFFKIAGQKFPKEVFLVPSIGIYISFQKFAIRQIQGH